MADPKYEDFDFSKWTAEFGHGVLNTQAGNALRKLMVACHDSRKKGKLTVTFEVAAVDGMAEIRAKIKVEVPQPGVPSGSYFLTETGALVTEDPKQLKLGGGKVLDMQPVRSIKDREPS